MRLKNLMFIMLLSSLMIPGLVYGQCPVDGTINLNGQTLQITGTVTGNPLNADFTIEVGVNTVIITFKSKKDANQHLWQVDGVEVGREKNLTYAFEAGSGRHTITHAVANLCELSVKNRDIVIGQECSDLSAEIRNASSGDRLNLFAKTLGNVTRYKWWVNGNALPSSNTDVVEYKPNQSGTFDVQLRVWDDDCNDNFTTNTTISFTVPEACEPEVIIVENCPDDIPDCDASAIRVIGANIQSGDVVCLNEIILAPRVELSPNRYTFKWYGDGYNTAQGRKISMTVNGSYGGRLVVVDNQNNGSEEEYCFVVTRDCDQFTTDTDNPENQSMTVVISPNPTTDLAKIEVSVDGKHQFAIYDLSGRKMSQGEFTGTSQQLDTSDLPSGTYVLHLKTGNQAIAKKFIKN